MPSYFHTYAHSRALSHDVVCQETPAECCDAEAHPYAGKEGIQVDLQTPEGKEVVQRLIAKADVLSHNFRSAFRSACSSVAVQVLAD